MATSTVEDYVKHIYLEQQEIGDEPVPMGRVAATLGVVPGTTTTMMKALDDAGLVKYEPRAGVRLTTAGESLALHILRRHRLIELFLVRILGMDWSEIHMEAEQLEHAISDLVLEKIDALLGHPTTDPHGDPIPTARGALDQPKLDSLCDCPLHQSVCIARIADQSPEFLHFIDQKGLKPGVELLLKERDPAADAITVRISTGRRITLGARAAEKILVN